MSKALAAVAVVVALVGIWWLTHSQERAPPSSAEATAPTPEDQEPPQPTRPVSPPRPPPQPERPVKWLPQHVPANAIVELDAWTDDPKSELRLEIWGDGKTAETGYTFIAGPQSFISRRDERAAGAPFTLEPGRHYHWKIIRLANQIAWFIDGKAFIGIGDTAMPVGAEHAFIAFESADPSAHFANLTVSEAGHAEKKTE